MSKWQFIETAPKDGRQLLLWDGRAVTVGRHDPEKAPFGSPWARLVLTDYYSNIFQPTHWMPLPEPPALKAVES
jgi:hypothetical protein